MAQDNPKPSMAPNTSEAHAEQCALRSFRVWLTDVRWHT